MILTKHLLPAVDEQVQDASREVKKYFNRDLINPAIDAVTANRGNIESSLSDFVNNYDKYR